ncbi:AMP-binding protein [uncultured Methylophaga sp.]|uniref:AMP-binding protein n=1 Tax=uncultured Methylophaga sp. TaxID=285271 RepID=UPI00262EB93A|nr:AMP-binding protein [uncultured Methylophaga sp.]
MSQIIQKLVGRARQRPDATAISNSEVSLSWTALLTLVDLAAEQLQSYRGQVVALLAENDIDWVVIDLACLKNGVILLPLPAFFSDQQRRFALRESGATAMILSNAESHDTLTPLIGNLALLALDCVTGTRIPDHTVKVTFTSGSTGQPKGVCLSEANQYRVVESLLRVTGLEQTRHLCVLPLATLLENIAGIYAPLLSGGEVVLLPAAELGFNGSRGFEVSRLLTAIERTQPDSLILLPELLSAMLISMEQGWLPPASLQFIAVGGSHVSPGLLEKSHLAGLPVYQGYGLSECSSVVSLNGPEQNQPGSTGQPLPHLSVTIEDGEIVVAGNAFLGYINSPQSWHPPRIYTGDLGYLDEQGYLYIKGRRKNLLINSFGRNINPEWIESEVLANPRIAQSVVIGDARPYCVALIYPRHTATPNVEIEQWLAEVNHSLPDYAQIVRWVRLSQPFSTDDGTLTANGKPVRERIAQRYQSNINDLYKERA